MNINEWIGKYVEVKYVGLVLDGRKVEVGDKGCIDGTEGENSITILWNTAKEGLTYTAIDNMTFLKLVDNEILVETESTDILLRFSEYDLVQKKDGSFSGIVVDKAYYNGSWIFSVRGLGSLVSGRNELKKIKQGDLEKCDKVSLDMCNEHYGNYKITVENMDKVNNDNLFSRDEQFYLLQYFLRTNFTAIEEILKAYDREKHNKSYMAKQLSDEVAAILYSEYGIKNGALVNEIVNLWLTE